MCIRLLGILLRREHRKGLRRKTLQKRREKREERKSEIEEETRPSRLKESLKTTKFNIENGKEGIKNIDEGPLKTEAKEEVNHNILQ